MEKHLEHRSRFLVQLDQSIVLGFLLTGIVFRLQIRQLSREGRALTGAEVSLENSITFLGSLVTIDIPRDRSSGLAVSMSRSK